MTDWSDGPVNVLIGDVRERLAELADESVHAVCTSPPYWGLRDYGAPGQLGLEATPQEYVAAMVEVFREVRRVLRTDGTLWLNLGDTYSQRQHGRSQTNGSSDGALGRGPRGNPARLMLEGLGEKQLVGIPWRVALALQADGWWLRSDIIWAKPNPMPESVSDRPTTAHEHVFLLTRSERYFYDADAVREPMDMRPQRRLSPGDIRRDAPGQTHQNGERALRSVAAQDGNPAGRNLRSVWRIATQPYPEAHFATFPEELARRCIAAGTSERGCCPECGAPWQRVVERTVTRPGVGGGSGWAGRTDPSVSDRTHRLTLRGGGFGDRSVTTTGWRPTCTHDAEPVPCTVLDPFAGSGTTLAVARRMGRRAIGIELQPDYLPLIQRRVAQAAMPVLEATTEPQPDAAQMALLDDGADGTARPSTVTNGVHPNGATICLTMEARGPE